MLVLVNQVNTLPAGGAETLLKDVHDLLIADGLQDVQVLPVSAVRGDNLGKVREILCDRVAHESNAARTASAELDAITARLTTPFTGALPRAPTPSRATVSYESSIGSCPPRTRFNSAT